MADPEGTRKLEAILAADVAGYSRLMQQDDEATVATLEAYRAVFREKVQAYRGRVVDMAGDSVLAVFEAATGAVRAALEIQALLAERNDALPETRRMRFRIGVNLGEVIERPDGTVYGDGVNIAARLESIGEPGGVTVSGTVFDQVKHRVQVGFDFIGEQEVKNIAELVRAYRVVAARQSPAGAPASKRIEPIWRRPLLISSVVVGLAALVLGSWQFAHRVHWTASLASSGNDVGLPLPSKPSIAVMPFVNLSGDQRQEYFSDGMTETLITDLSRLANLFVIARNSTFAYKGKALDVRRVGRELGVRYVLEGSVQKTNERLRVSAQLVEASTAQQLWAERYDRSPTEVLEIQDDIAKHIVTELEVKLLSGEQVRSWHRTTRNSEAYDLFLKGGSLLGKNTKEDVAAAQILFEQALHLDPKFAMAMVWQSFTYYAQGDAGWSNDPRESYLKAVALARQAIAIEPSLGEAYSSLANTLLTLQQHSEAVTAAEKAITLSPNDANTLALSGWVLALTGRAAESKPLVERALRLDPLPPGWYYGAMGDSLLFANHVDEAVQSHRKCVQLVPDFIWCELGLTVDYVESGKLDEAHVQAKEAIRINSHITAEDNTYTRSIGVREDRARVVAALHRPGLK